MNHKEDRAFMRQFAGVIAAFIVLTIVLIFVARGMQPAAEENGESSKAILAKERVAPVGAVRSGEAGAAALAEAQAAAAEAAVPEEVVVDGPAVYGSLCRVGVPVRRRAAR